MDNPNFFLAMNHLRKVFHQHLQEKKGFSSAATRIMWPFAKREEEKKNSWPAGD
jgi:hypothetical protein